MYGWSIACLTNDDTRRLIQTPLEYSSHFQMVSKRDIMLQLSCKITCQVVKLYKKHRNIYIYIFFHFITLRCHRELKAFRVEDTDMFALHVIYHGSGWTGNPRNHDIISHWIYQVCRVYSSFGITRFYEYRHRVRSRDSPKYIPSDM